MAVSEPFDRLEHFTVTAPAGTLSTAPIERQTRFAPGIVVGVGIVIPAGHAGATGIQIAAAHQAIIPATAGAFLISDREIIEWPLEGMVESGQYSCWVYNTDTNPHNWYVRYFVREVANARASGTSLVEPVIL